MDDYPRLTWNGLPPSNGPNTGYTILSPPKRKNRKPLVPVHVTEKIASGTPGSTTEISEIGSSLKRPRQYAVKALGKLADISFSSLLAYGGSVLKRLRKDHGESTGASDTKTENGDQLAQMSEGESVLKRCDKDLGKSSETHVENPKCAAVSSETSASAESEDPVAETLKGGSVVKCPLEDLGESSETFVANPIPAADSSASGACVGSS